MVKKYLSLNDRKNIGYNDEEIEKIEKLYDIEIKGDFRTFMKFCGKYDGGFIGSNLIILYQEWGIRNYLEFMMTFSDYLIETVNASADVGNEIFVFAIENDV